MAHEPITNFSNRAAKVSGALRMTGVVPNAAEAMSRVDDKIGARINDFDKHYASPERDKLKAAATKWAKASKGNFTDLDALINAPAGNELTTVPIRVKTAWGEEWQHQTVSTPQARRKADARKLVLDNLIAKYDEPNYSTAALIESCKPAVREWFNNFAIEATEALEGLDEAARDKAMTTGRMNSVLDLIDPVATPEATITAYRRAARAWAHMDELPDGEYTALARAMAFHDVSDTPETERDVFDRMEQLTSHRARFHAILFDAETCALAVFDMNPLKAVATGLGHIAPLADPLGDDLPELERRLAAISGAVGWLDHRSRTVGDRHGGNKGMYSDHERYGESTPAASLASFKAERPEVFSPVDYDPNQSDEIYTD